MEICNQVMHNQKLCQHQLNSTAIKVAGMIVDFQRKCTAMTKVTTDALQMILDKAMLHI